MPKRKFKSTTRSGGYVAPGTKVSEHREDKLHMSAKVRPPGYTGGAGGAAVAQPGAAPGGGAGFSSVKASRTGVKTQDVTRQAPTLRESYVTYESQTSTAPTITDVVKPNQSPAPQDKSELVFIVGIALIIASGLTNKHIQAVADLFFNAKNMKYTKQQARVGMVVIGGELLFLIILTSISESSDGFANVALVLLFALALIWSINNIKTSQGWINFLTGKAKNI